MYMQNENETRTLNPFLILFRFRYLVFYGIATSGRFWLTYLLAVVACLVPDMAVMHYTRWYHPKDWQIYQVSIGEGRFRSA